MTGTFARRGGSYGENQGNQNKDAKLTELILAEAIEHQALAELVRLAANDDRDSVLLRQHGNHSGSRPRVYSSV